MADKTFKCIVAYSIGVVYEVTAATEEEAFDKCRDHTFDVVETNHENCPNDKDVAWCEWEQYDTTDGYCEEIDT
jgi:hypothetical protein